MIATKLLQKKKHEKGFVQDSAKETGVHPDQQELVMKLKVVKKSMQKVKLLYQGQDINIWEFAGFFTSGEDSYVYGNNALFEDKVKKTKLM